MVESAQVPHSILPKIKEKKIATMYRKEKKKCSLS